MVRKNSLIVLFIVSALLAACAPQATQPPAPLETQPVETQLPESLPPTEVIPAVETQPVSVLWTGYRDDRFGIGLAFPCWWAFTPMPTEGYGGAISLRSFDEEYFRAHSTKGNWNNSTPPEGVFALDIAVFEGIDPALSTADAWLTFTDPDMSAIASAEEQVVGQNTALVIQMQNMNNPTDPPATLYLYRLAPDKLLMVNPFFQDRLDADDIQGILTSLSLSPDVPIQVPTVAPHEPLIPAACANN